MRLLGYADRLSVEAGQQIEFKVSCESEQFRPTVVRLLRGGSPSIGTAVVEETVASDLDETYPGRVQTTIAGSYLDGALSASAPLRGVGLAAWILPTTPGLDVSQSVVSMSSSDGSTAFTLAVTAQGCALLGARERLLVSTSVALVERQWCFVAATITDGGEVTLTQARPGSPPITVRAAAPAGDRAATAVVDRVRIAASAGADGPGGHFNGKLARPVAAVSAWDETVTTRLRLGHDPTELVSRDALCAFDLAGDQASLRVDDRGGLTTGGTLVNLPARGIPGPFWSGVDLSFRECPAEFDAVHFHDDDLADARWQTDLTLTVPSAWRSGVYALKVCADDDVDRIPFVVRPRSGDRSAPVLVVLPTWTYLAYANWRSYAEAEDARATLYGERRPADPRDRWLVDHPELGKSLYDVHRDGSGVMYSSRLRPVLSLRPDYFTPTTRGLRHFAQDLYLIEWLEKRGEDYAVVTDEDLDAEGCALLKRHRVVMTGSHPEYCSSGMLDAYSEYTRSGGRLMYLGGNGFYWVTARHPHSTGAIEIRRWRGSDPSWASDPGEGYLAGTGEPGGLWRSRGRHPQRLVGVGFTAQGFDKASPYRRTPESYGEDVSWVFRGVPDDVFGEDGEGLGGAAGDELDRADVTLGTPAEAVILATSFGHSEKIELVREEVVGFPHAGGRSRVRSDVLIFGLPDGGAVFSVGSIAWSSAMAHDGGVNDVSLITGNVLDVFLDADDPLDPAAPVQERPRSPVEATARSY